MVWSDWSSPCHLSSFLTHRLSPPCFCSSHTHLPLIFALIHQACFCPRAFACALPSTWNALPRASLQLCWWSLLCSPSRIGATFPHFLSLSIPFYSMLFFFVAISPSPLYKAPTCLQSNSLSLDTSYLNLSLFFNSTSSHLHILVPP